MRISEIFRSIQGESTYAGLPCTFVRTSGCSLRCSYCDTGYALWKESGIEMSLDTILLQVERLGIDLVEVTGGEPLEQPDIAVLCQSLLDRQATVLIETSGAFPINLLPPAVIRIMDIKTPSSRMMEWNHWENIQYLTPRDEIKFVIGNREDFDWSLAVCRDKKIFGSFPILFSPSFSRMSPRDLAEWILQEKIPVRMQLQIHKHIWPPDRRGV